MSISVIILTFNSEDSILATLESARHVSDDIHVVDSYSTDNTSVIARNFGARFVQHPFANYGAQRNWAIENLDLKHEWELHLDADERLSYDLVAEIKNLMATASSESGGGEALCNGYYLPRLVHFLGTPIRHGGMFPIWHLRLFRRELGRCEDRRYDQHFMVEGRTERLNAPMIDDMRMDLSEWAVRHVRWAAAEAEEVLSPGAKGVIQGRLLGSPVERKRALRGGYYLLPPFLRPMLFFLYRYILRLGFLDGVPGLIFFTLQTFWFRFMVDAKIYEMKRVASGTGSTEKRDKGR